MTALGESSFPLQGPVSLHQVLEVVAEFDGHGGASLGLVAWELCAEEELAAPAWQQAISDGLIGPAGRDCQERLWRLSSAGWAAAASATAPPSREPHQQLVGSQAQPIASYSPERDVPAAPMDDPKRGRRS